jgi:hypothetical protein
VLWMSQVSHLDFSQYYGLIAALWLGKRHSGVCLDPGGHTIRGWGWGDIGSRSPCCCVA